MNCIAALNFVFDRNSLDFEKLACFSWCLPYSTYLICDLHIPYSNLFDLFSFPANVSSYSHYVFSALVQDDSEVITFEVNFVCGIRFQTFHIALKECSSKSTRSSDTFSRILLLVFQSSWTGLRRRSWSGHFTFTTWTGTELSPGRRWRTSPCRSVAVKFLRCELCVWMGFHFKYLAFKCKLRPPDARMDNLQCTDYNAKLENWSPKSNLEFFRKDPKTFSLMYEVHGRHEISVSRTLWYVNILQKTLLTIKLLGKKLEWTDSFAQHFTRLF